MYYKICCSINVTHYPLVLFTNNFDSCFAHLHASLLFQRPDLIKRLQVVSFVVLHDALVVVSVACFERRPSFTRHEL